MVRVTADIKDAQSGFSRLSNTVNDFTKKNMSLNGIMAQAAGAIGKLGVAFGAAEVASKAFNAIMDGSQAFGDKVRNSMTALNTTLGTLAGNIASMDFSNMTDGLGAMISRAYEAAGAMDALWNVQLSGGVISSGAQLEFKENLVKARDKTLSEEERKAFFDKALAALEKMDDTLAYQMEATMKAVIADISATIGVSADKISADVVRAAIEAQGTAAGQERLAEALVAMKTQPVDRDARTFTSPTAGVSFSSGPSEQYKRDMTAWNDANIENRIYNAVNERKSDESLQRLAQMFTMMDNLLRQRTELTQQTFEVRNGFGAGGGGAKAKPAKSSLDMKGVAIPEAPGTTKSMRELNAELARFRQMMETATTTAAFNTAQDGIRRVQAEIEAQPLALRVGMDTESVAGLKTRIDEQTEQMRSEMRPIEIPVELPVNLSKDGKKSADAWQAAANAVSNVGSALGNIDNKGVNVAGMIMEAVANIALGFAQAAASPATGAAGVFGWIAAATAGLATMTATIAGIKQATKGSFAAGGIVPGTYNGGMDSTYVYASPGEVILNRAQQQNLVAQLDGADNPDERVRVTGEEMYTVIRNFMKRTGRKW